MEKAFVGKIVNTHGVKGEFRIKSDFERKSEVFVIGNNIIINNNTYEITSYRVHKGYDMITVKGLNDLNAVLPLKGLKVFVDRAILDINNNDYLFEDLIGSKVVFKGMDVGIVSDYTLGANPLIYIKDDDGKEKMVPLNENFIEKFDKDTLTVYISNAAEGLL